MKKSRGQTTIFIIIAILIVASVVLFFILREDSTNVGPGSPGSVTDSVNSYVEECLHSSGEAALFYIGQAGGYYLPDEGAKFSEYGYPYYVLRGKTEIPSKNKIESEISEFVQGSLVECTGNFSKISSSIQEKEEPEIKTKIHPKKVSIEADYPLVLNKGNNTKILKEFSSDLRVRLGLIHEFSKGIAQEHVNERRGVCYDCIEGNYFNKGLKFYTLGGIEEDTIEYRIVDPKSKLNDESSDSGEFDYEFGFVVQEGGNA